MQASLSRPVSWQNGRLLFPSSTGSPANTWLGPWLRSRIYRESRFRRRRAAPTVSQLNTRPWCVLDGRTSFSPRPSPSACSLLRPGCGVAPEGDLVRIWVTLWFVSPLRRLPIIEKPYRSLVQSLVTSNLGVQRAWPRKRLFVLARANCLGSGNGNYWARQRKWSSDYSFKSETRYPGPVAERLRWADFSYW